MFNQDFFVRVLVAILGAVLVIALLPAFFRLIGFPVTSDLVLVIKLVVAAIAVFYVFKR